MTITVKLPGALEQALRQRCATEERSISDIMRDALQAYLTAAPVLPASAWSLGSDLFGRHDGPADLASQRHAHAAAVWADKHARRSAPSA